MKKLCFIGDIHGNFETVESAISKFPNHRIIQVGDFGIGFQEFPNFRNLRSKFEFIRGNHDSPIMCSHLRNCHHNWHYDDKDSILFISGAQSTDVHRRTEDIDWWRDEELSFHQIDTLLNWAETNPVPKIIVSHDGPAEYVESNLDPYATPHSRTRQFLESLIYIWETKEDNKLPEYWIHGHHHIAKITEWKSMKMISLGIDEIYELAV
jgi:hypothetical protein